MLSRFYFIGLLSANFVFIAIQKGSNLKSVVVAVVVLSDGVSSGGGISSSSSSGEWWY